MRIERSWAKLLIASLILAQGSAAYATPPLPSFEEQMLRGAVIVMCHTVKSEEDRAYLDQDEAVGRETFFRIFGELNIADPTDIVANGYKAEELFRQRLVQAADDAQKQVQEKGCAEMERQTAPAAAGEKP